MRILLWHVHGSWTTGFVQGSQQYVVPVLADRGPDGRGRARTWQWPESVSEVPPERLPAEEIDVVVVQRPHELEHQVEDWLGRRPGRDVPTVYLEHNAPQGAIADMRHPAADRPDVTVVHVTHFNDLFWDCGSTPTRVIEHGIMDPGYRYTGEIDHPAVVINDARRRGRVTGTDLLERFAPVDLFGLDAQAIGGTEEVRQDRLHDELPRRRLYLHPIRWTSLGLSLIEAMQLGMPVVALGTTEAPEAVPREAGVVSTDVDVLATAVRRFAADAELARAAGREARRAALDRYGLDRFLADWDELLAEVAA
jgi:glycosyltransferase involved in cell wall biosynthesis